ncbi:MAG: hypothetical protein BZ135_00285, partial [Methanosphaera sp. rholeuAM6]
KTNTTKFNVDKAKSNVNVSAVNITRGYNETITVTLPEYQHATGNISVVIYDSENNPVESYIIECPGNLNVDLNETIIENLLNGTYTVNVTFTNDTNYNDSNATATFNVSLPIITIYDSQTIYVNESVLIYGVVRDMNNNIPEGNVLVKVDGHGSYTVSYTEFESGSAITFIESGVYYANATYVLFGQEIVTSENIMITVNRIPTNTTVNIINDTYGNVLIDVVVRENATGYSNIITSGQLNVTVGNGQMVPVNINGENTTINITQYITTAGDINVKVDYNGSVKYVNSTGTASIDVNAKASNVTIDISPADNIRINNTITISGQVFDQYGNVVDSGKVNISVDGQEGEVVDFTGGTYTLTGNRNTTYAGTITVQVTYLGQKDGNNYIISPSVNQTTFTVEKLPTNTTVTVLNNTSGNVTIDVKVVVDNETGNAVKQGMLNISVAGIEYQYTYDVADENVTIKLSEIDAFKDYLKYGNVSVKVTYNGSEVFLSSTGKDDADNVFKNVTLTGQSVNVTVAANITSTQLTQPVNITGNITSDMDDSFEGKVIYLNITGEDNLIPVTVNSTNGYSYEYVARTLGTINVNATFTDNTGYYNNASDKTSFTVGKIPTKTNVTILNSTVGNVTVHVNVTNLTDDPVERGHVVVCDNQTGQIVGEGELVNGGVDITLNVNTVGNVKVNVTYQENDIYFGSNGRNSSIIDDNDPEVNITNIDVVKQISQISIGLNPEVLIVGENVYIRGTVMVDGELLTSGKVNVTVNGTNTTVDINSDGSYNLTYTASVAGFYTVNATYLGNDSINAVTSGNRDFTVNKMPTNTTVTIVNNTVGHVVIEVSVTNNTGAPV